MKKNGFTLVELLAVIVVLGIIMVIVGRSLTSTKREANIKEAEKIKSSIKEIGLEVYTYEKELGIFDDKSYCEKELNSTYDEENSTCDNPSFSGNEYMQYFTYIYENESEVYIDLENLYNAGYIKNIVKDEFGNFAGIKNPAGGTACTGFLRVQDAAFEACLKCPGITGFETDCSLGATKALLTK